MGDVLRLAFVTFGFLGMAPVMPGTFGTLGGVLIAWLIGMYAGNFLVGTIVAAVVLYAIARSLGDWAEQYAGKKDPGLFVVDAPVPGLTHRYQDKVLFLTLDTCPVYCRLNPR